jgi:hypothetical protein
MKRIVTGMLLLAFGVVAGSISFAPRPASAAAVVTIINNDGAGEGFNDATAAVPVGGNAGVTIGQQRLIAFQFAANVWGATLDSNVPILVQANFDPLSCTATAAVLGSAGATFIFTNYVPIPPWPGPEFLATWYCSALADKRAGQELNPGFPDIAARFNSNLGNAGCLTGIFWYYGLDGNHGANIDLVTVLLHELGHGLGFQQFASVTTGLQCCALPAPRQTDVYARHLLDTTTGKTWDQMIDAERVASAINTQRVVWNGAVVGAKVPLVLASGTPLVRVNSPAVIAGNYPVGTAAFGPALSSPGVTGDLELVNDGAGASTSDACEPLVGFTPGHIAILDRGTCTFVVKVKVAQDAGAIAAIVVDNVAGSPPAGLGGTDPTITIPAVRVSLADGNAIKAQLGGGVNVTLGVDLTIRAGANPAGLAMLYTPVPVASGSTISHWDTSAFPNQLMEPAINADLTHSLIPPQDLTLALMRDIGWFVDQDLDGIPDAGDPVAIAQIRLTVDRLVDGAAVVRWDPVAMQSFAGFRVYRQVPGSERVEISNGTLSSASYLQFKDPSAPAGGADYWLAGVAESGVETWFGPVTLGSTVRPGVRLAVNSNPFRPGSSISFALPDSRPAELAVYNVAGRQVATLASGAPGIGEHIVRWDGRNQHGQDVQLRAGTVTRTEKLVLIR